MTLLRRYRLGLAAAIAATALTLAAGPAAARPGPGEPPRVVRFASVGGATDAPVFLAQEYGFLREEGLSVDLQRMNNAPALTAAVATNQIDVAGISLTPGLFASVQQGMNLRLVGDKQSLRPGFSATRLIVSKAAARESEAATVRGLEGKSVAVSSKAASTYYLLARLLEKHGMTLSDVQVVELSFPNMLPALTSGAIDGALSLEPFLSQAVQAGEAEVVSDLVEFVPEGGSIVPLVYSEQFAADGDAARRFMKAYVRGVRVYNDALTKGKDADRVVEIISRYAKVSPQVIRDSFPAGLDPNQKLSIDFLKTVQSFFVKEGSLRSPIDVDRIVDRSFAEAAVGELGEYR